MKTDIEYGEYLVSQFERLTSKSKAVIFAYVFSEDECAELLKNYILATTEFDYSYCKSPIEEIFAVAYNMRLAEDGFPYTETLDLRPQEKIVANNNTYYADFLIEMKSSKWFKCENPYKLVIECDGHEFHEKTKAQVEKRNQRDMDLKSAGYDILHFSGSQIFKHPIECANKAYEYIRSKVGEVDFNNGDI